MEYKGLQYKIKGNQNPKGKPRVYFCCHKDDFDALFETVSEEILSRQNHAAIWYYNPEEEAPNGDEFLADLSQMQLFVIPVTWRFLYQDSVARTVELAYAMEHNIPMLFLMQENGLESDFNRIVGPYQTINPKNLDETAISYDDKLTSYLENVLVSDELSQKVRAAFKAYVFLSYRKKDRRYGQELMRAIETDDRFRDIAIWYDEFLTVGKDFNESIDAMMKKSEVMLLAVTPNLLEKPNYVMDVEYVEAKKAGKKILPVEMVATDREELSACYEGILDVVSFSNIDEVKALLMRKLSSVDFSVVDNSPEQLYCMGLASLSGVDVMVHHEKAVALLTKAANLGHLDALEKMVSIYCHGEGVKRNYHTAIEWQKKYVEELKNRCEEERYQVEHLYLGDLLWKNGYLSEARAVYEEMLEELLRCDKQEDSFEKNNLLEICYSRIGDVYAQEDEILLAKQYFLKALEINRQYIGEDADESVLRSVSLIYDRLSNIMQQLCELKEAEYFCEKSIQIREQLVEANPSPENKYELAIAYDNMGDILSMSRVRNLAISYHEKSIEICDYLAEEMNWNQAKRMASIGYEKLGMIAFSKGEYSKAYAKYVKAMAYRTYILKDEDTIEANKDYAVICYLIGDVFVAQNDFFKALGHTLRSVATAKKLTMQVENADTLMIYAIAILRLGVLYEHMRNNAMAKKQYEIAVNLYERLETHSSTMDNRRALGICYYNLANICGKLGDKKNGIVYCQMSEIIMRELAREVKLDKDINMILAISKLKKLLNEK